MQGGMGGAENKIPMQTVSCVEIPRCCVGVINVVLVRAGKPGEGGRTLRMNNEGVIHVVAMRMKH